MNEFFIYLEDITVSPEYLRRQRIFKMTAVALRPKTFQELVFKAAKSRKRSGYLIDSAQVRSIDRKSVFLQTKATHFETMMTTVDEVNRHKTKVPDIFFVMFRLSVLLLNSSR